MEDFSAPGVELAAYGVELAAAGGELAAPGVKLAASGGNSQAPGVEMAAAGLELRPPKPRRPGAYCAGPETRARRPVPWLDVRNNQVTMIYLGRVSAQFRAENRRR